MADRRHLAKLYTVTHYTIFDNKTANINTKNCSLSILLTETDQKFQKSLKRLYTYFIFI